MSGKFKQGFQEKLASGAFCLLLFIFKFQLSCYCHYLNNNIIGGTEFDARMQEMAFLSF